MDVAPPWVFSRESQIRIDRDGRFWHEGARVLHPQLERALASWVDIEPETGRYILKNTLDWCYVTVDDTPLVVRSLRQPSDGAVPMLELSDGTTEPLPQEGLWMTAEGVVYGKLRGGRIPARFDRTASFTLLEHAEGESEGDVTLHFGDLTVAVAQVR